MTISSALSSSALVTAFPGGFVVTDFFITISLVVLSSRMRRKTGWRNLPSFVRSVNLISQTYLGLIQVTGILVFTFSANGALLVIRGFSFSATSFSDLS